MKAIVMAGGFGTRLRPLTINRPKPMVPVLNRPMMEHVVSLLARHGLTDITALLYFQSDAIREHFGDGSKFGVNMSYVKPEEDYGTAGAVAFALEDSSKPVIVISGDLITNFDLGQAIKWHQDKKAEATILLTRLDNPLAYGIVITDEDDQIVRFLEKPTWSEAFSDTINTGIYILEPAVINMIPQKTNFDFSQDLYPKMLSNKMKLYGRISDGYWRDVGNIDEYRQVHYDIFDDKPSAEISVYESKEYSGGTLYYDKRAKVPEKISIKGKVFIARGVQISESAKLENCVIGANTEIGAGALIKKSIIWENTKIGAETSMTEAIVCSNSKLGHNVQLLDNVVVSDECTIGDSATVKANCKIWPGKSVDDGAVVSSSMVWGEKWNRELFTDSKITGLALTEITPEMAVKIGSAFGAFLGEGSSLVTSRDASDASRLLKRGMLSGILAAGVTADDLEMLPIPVVRYCLHNGSYSAGIYFRHNPLDYRLIDIIFFDGDGLDMPPSKLKKVERLYIGEDYQRVTLDKIGRLNRPKFLLEDYRREFMSHIKKDIIKKAGVKIVIDHSNGASTQIFPAIFSELGVSAVELNASLNPSRELAGGAEMSFLASTAQVSSIVKSLNADIGFVINPAAEKIKVVDGDGLPIDDQLLLLIVTELFLKLHQVKKIAVPVNASMGVEKIAAEHKVEVIRVPSTHLAMMEIFRKGEVSFVGGTIGGFIFPGFQKASDAILSVIKLLEMLAESGETLAALRQKLDIYKSQTAAVPCPWSSKGRVLRKLITEAKDKKHQLIDGVRIFENGGWVLVTPDRYKASFNIIAETTSEDETSALIEQYKSRVENFRNN